VSPSVEFGDIETDGATLPTYEVPGQHQVMPAIANGEASSELHAVCLYTMFAYHLSYAIRYVEFLTCQDW
jgi:hypothetical protein